MLRVIVPALSIVMLVADTGSAAARHGGGLLAVARISGLLGLPLPLGHHRGRHHFAGRHHHFAGRHHHFEGGRRAIARDAGAAGDRARSGERTATEPTTTRPPLLRNTALVTSTGRSAVPHRAAARMTFRGGLASDRARGDGPGLVIGWAGTTFWPYAQQDVLDYIFQPHAFDVFWPYAYDDVYDGLFWPYVPTALAATDHRRARHAESGGTAICAGPMPNAAATSHIADTIRPTAAQKAALDDLQSAAAASVNFLQSSCPTDLPPSPMQRLMAMRKRAQVMLRAVLMMEPAYNNFYRSLTEEQRARFDAMPSTGEKKAGGGQSGQEQAAAAAAPAPPPTGAGAAPATSPQPAAPGAPPAGTQPADAQPADAQAAAAAHAADPRAAAAAQTAAAQAVFAGCGKARGAAGSPLDAIERVVQPTEAQRAVLDDLKQAVFKAAYMLKADCSEGPTPPPGDRVADMRQRLWTVVVALNLIRPALAKFTASLSDEQKRRFDMPLRGAART